MDFRYYEKPENRKLRVLDSVIRLYTEHAEPVSSSAVCRDAQHCWSSATVRKIFTELEELGWLMQPHRSAGRIPTDLGYRIYVEQVVRPSCGQAAWENWLSSELDLREVALSRILEQAVGLLSRVSHAIGLSLLVFTPGADSAEGDVRITGVDELLEQPEFQDPSRLKILIHLLDDVKPFSGYMRDVADSPGEIRLCIGEENTLTALSEFSLITTRIDRSEETALLGLLGPVRMEYPLVLNAMESLVHLLHVGPASRKSWS